MCLYTLFGRGEPTLGYVVDAKLAFEALAISAPEAAQWWRMQLAAHTTLLFDAGCAELEPKTKINRTK
jgi:hypothetical protein